MRTCWRAPRWGAAAAWSLAALGRGCGTASPTASRGLETHECSVLTACPIAGAATATACDDDHPCDADLVCERCPDEYECGSASRCDPTSPDSDPSGCSLIAGTPTGCGG